MMVEGVELIDNGDMVVLSQSRNGYFEPESMRAWKNAAKADHAVMDIGAYSGLYSIAAFQSGAGHIIAYEPNPTMYKRMMDNCHANSVTNITFVNAAAGSTDRTATLSMSFAMTSAGSIDHVVKKARQSRRVKVQRPYTSRPVSAVKIDVEGSELDVLIGLIPIIERDHPMIIAEALTPAAQQDLVDFLKRRGYTHTIADDRNLIFTSCAL